MTWTWFAVLRSPKRVWNTGRFFGWPPQSLVKSREVAAEWKRRVNSFGFMDFYGCLWYIEVVIIWWFNIANWKVHEINGGLVRWENHLFLWAMASIAMLNHQRLHMFFFQPTMTTVAAPARDPLIELGQSVKSWFSGNPPVDPLDQKLLGGLEPWNFMTFHMLGRINNPNWLSLHHSSER